MSTDYGKLTASDLRELIVQDSYGTIDEISVKEIKGKNKLIAVHKGLVEEDEELNEEIVDNETVTEHVEELKPTYCSEKWQEFVMSHFKDDELVPDKRGNMNPTLSGLRRISQLLLGRIVSCGPIEVWPSTDMEGPGRATVLYEVVFDWQIEYEDNNIRTFKAVAGSWYGNTDKELAVYPEAMAESRAEGRALRKALAITNVCAEELTNLDTESIVEQHMDKLSNDFAEDALINSTQKNVIEKMCNRLQIDMTKFVNSGDRTYTDISQVARSTAANMIARLNQYQTHGKDSVEIPDSIKI